MSAIASKSVQTPARENGSHRLPPAAVPDYIERNRGAWERWWPGYVESGREAWAADELRWGIWGIPESELRLLDGLEAGADVIELGCGTAAICAWLARRGFSPMGVDIARPLLETAAEFEREFRVGFPLLCANAEQLHFEDASFDCAISEYGASLWCDPHRWVAEAARLLRPNGLLVFVTNSALLVSCTPDGGGLAGDRVVRDYFSRYRVEFEGTDAVEFHLNHGNWVRLLRTNGFVLEDLVEPRPPEGASPPFPFVSPAWAQFSPSEEIWVARKAPPPSFSDDASEKPEVLAAGHDLPRPQEDPEIPPDEAAGSATATSEAESRPRGSASRSRPRSRKRRARRHGRSRR
jgi:SAM-dependent methyltransferase